MVHDMPDVTLGVDDTCARLTSSLPSAWPAFGPASFPRMSFVGACVFADDDDAVDVFAA
jgi:hypothetical protein